MQSGAGVVSVVLSNGCWFTVTCHEDRAAVAAPIKEMSREGLFITLHYKEMK